MTLKRTRLPQKISAKRLKALGGKAPFSSITAKPKPLRAVNPEREAKRRQTRRKNHAKYRASETFKIVTARAAGQCEASVRWAWGAAGIELVEIRADLAWMAHATHVRCWANEGLEHHHVHYPDKPGGETPDDVLVCCKRCHGWIERVNHPTRKNGRNYA